MSVDSYAPCPCGSGKKVKFCCQAILPEMEKVERLLENNQPRMALQTLEKILPEHGGNAWVATAQGWALIADRRPADAKAALAQFLRKNPDHPSANALHALAAFQADGIPAAKKAVHRAFRRSFRAEPSIVTGLAASMAELYLQQDHVLAARQHYALALRYGDDEDRKHAFTAMVEIDGDAAIAYPLRGVHNVPEFHGTPATQETIQKAHRLSAVGCWEEASELLRQACEQQPDSPEGWHTLGLFQAWDGNNSAAADSLHKAAALTSDFETAVECETLAQLLKGATSEDAAESTSLTYTVESVSRLLTRLDEQPRFARVPDLALQASGLNQVIAAEYEVLDRTVPTGDTLNSITLETAPRLMARVLVLNQQAEAADTHPAKVIVSVAESIDLATARSSFEEAAGDAVIRAEAIPPGPRLNSVFFTRERRPLRPRHFLPYDVTATVRERVELEHHTNVIGNLWPSLPQAALGDKSPREARGVPELRVPLAAAINVLDAICDSQMRLLSVNDLRREYDLPAMEPIEVAADANVNVLSLMQLRRINLRTLADGQFRAVLRRVLLSRHSLHAYETLREYLENRTHLHAEAPRERDEAMEALVDICRRTLRREEALRWAQHGQALARTSERPFEMLLTWKMKELTLRLEDRNDPQAKALFDEVWNQFGSKLPQLRESLAQLAAYVGLEPPGQGVVVASAGGPEAGINLEPASAASEKKLWLPGMD